MSETGEQPPVDQEGEAPEDGDAKTYTEAAREKAQGMVDYMFGKPKEDEDGNPIELSIGERIEENPLEMEFMKAYLDVVPEKITMDKVPRIMEMRTEWRVGMRVVEEAFSSHVGNMHLDFEKKAKEYEKI